jgi:hypothetical protein
VELIGPAPFSDGERGVTRFHRRCYGRQSALIGAECPLRFVRIPLRAGLFR